MGGPPAPQGLPRGGPSHIHAGNGRACRSLTARGGGYLLIEVRVSPAQRWILSEWERSASEFKREASGVEKASAAMRSEFAELLAEVLPEGALLPLGESTPDEDSEGLNEWI